MRACFFGGGQEIRIIPDRISESFVFFRNHHFKPFLDGSVFKLLHFISEKNN